MTKEFMMMQDAFEDVDGELSEENKIVYENCVKDFGTFGKLVCLKQIATSLIDIEKELKKIEEQMKRRR